MCLMISSWDMVERSLILDRLEFKTGPVSGDGLATGGVAFTGGTLFGDTGSCVTEGMGAGTCLAEWQVYWMASQSLGAGGGGMDFEGKIRLDIVKALKGSFSTNWFVAEVVVFGGVNC